MNKLAKISKNNKLEIEKLRQIYSDEEKKTEFSFTIRCKIFNQENIVKLLPNTISNWLMEWRDA